MTTLLNAALGPLAALAAVGLGLLLRFDPGPSMPAPPPPPPPAEEDAGRLAELARQRKSLEAKRAGRSRLVIEPDPGLRIIE